MQHLIGEVVADTLLEERKCRVGVPPHISEGFQSNQSILHVVQFLCNWNTPMDKPFKKFAPEADGPQWQSHAAACRLPQPLVHRAGALSQCCPAGDRAFFKDPPGKFAFKFA